MLEISLMKGWSQPYLIELQGIATVQPFMIRSSTFQPGNYKKMYESAQRVRTNRRFPVPTILWNGKFLCRTAGVDVVSVAADMNTILLNEGSSASDFEFQINIATAAFFMKVKKFSIDMSVDVHLLNHLEVTHICDLRGRDPSRDYPKFAETCELYKTYYTAFKTAHLPYPSVDFFETYYRIREPEELRLNWKKKSPPLFDLTLPDIDSMTLLQTDVSKYREWYTLDQTLNYLLVLQTYLTSDLLSVKGILLHCIAGQDRTPLFVTLLRLSLWADGLLHATLNPLEMLYLTVAYDWYLFGHNLKDCLNRGYWIMHFCYNILDHITSDRFSVRGSEVETASSRCILPCFRPKTDRKKRLLEVKRLFLKFYAQIERRPVQQPSTSTGRR
ncbi:myotubularin-related protein 14-like isoform X3 [Stegodyphus dumicola]|uniref:myotubularin-related protein 14-like isoform X3 n=1 Tax=Stegodyphus dumicola TaxID=202533 RepID=UPI0015A86074|nr:myotubularin-related protein 14-like isoform X3 [Stegodyphus dumicola]